MNEFLRDVTDFLERSDLRIVVRLGVVHGHPSVGLLEAGIALLGDSVERAIARLEEEHGSPVIGEVFAEGASGAG